MRFYIASHSKEAASQAALECARSGHGVTSRWHSQDEFKPTEEYSEKERRLIATMDHYDVTQANALILLAGPSKYSGGKFVEAGIALGLRKPVIVVGRRENMLLWHRDVRRVDTVHEAIEAAKRETPEATDA